MLTSGRRRLAGSVLFLAAYWASAWVLSGGTFLRESVAWLPTGMAVAGVLILGDFVAVLTGVATLVQRVYTGHPLDQSLFMAVGNGLEAWTAALLLRRLDFRRDLLRLRDLLALVAVAAVAPIISASVAALVYRWRALPSAFIQSAWLSWYRMNALGILIVTPLILAWSTRPLERPTRRAFIEILTALAAVALSLWFVVSGAALGDLGVVLSYMALPVVLYAAMRFGLRGAATIAALLSVLAVVATLRGVGPFVSTPLGVRHLALQAFILILTLAPLLLGAVIAEREAALADGVRSDAERDAFRRILPDVTYRIRSDGTCLEVYVPSSGPPTAAAAAATHEVPPVLAEELRAAVQDVVAGVPVEPLEYREAVEGQTRVREARFVRLGPDQALGMVRDITARKEAEAILGLQADVLERMATGRPTAEVLQALVRGSERVMEGAICSILRLEGRRLYLASGPSLPVEYSTAIDGVEIGPRVGSCGTATYLGETVVVTDIATDPLWEDYRGIALPHGLRACWSVPIRGSSGEVLGSFAIYYRAPRSPESHELSVIERAAALAGIAIERERREHLLASINRNVNEGLYRSTPDRGLIYVNSAFARMFGYDSPEEMLRLTSAMLYDDPGRREELKQLIVKQGFFTNEEVRFVRRDGSRFWGLVTSTGVRGPGGGVEFYDGAVSDITARKRLEEQLRHAQKMEAVGKLAGGVAHDFNNLLTAITGYAHSLLLTLAPHDPAHADAEEITRAAQRAATLTRQLLAYSRQQVLDPQVLDLSLVVAQLGGMLDRLIGEDVRLIVTPASQPALVRVDRGQIEQVVLNLALNSRDAMPHGGTLAIATAPVDLDEEFAGQHLGLEAGPYVCLSVIDTGHGMDPETCRRAFDPFFTTKEVGKGTGLGLSTVHGIVHQSGGTVVLESSPGAGTTAWVYLPRIVAPQAAAREPVLSIPAPAPGGTILVVEDEPLVRDLVSRTLRRAGYGVLVADNGVEALQLVRRTAGPLDLVVSDVVMPGMGGRELSERLAVERPGLRVLFVSGYTSEALAVHGVLHPGTEYLQKPFSPSDLLDRVRDLLTAERASG